MKTFFAAIAFAAAVVAAPAADNLIPNSYIVQLNRDRPESGDFYAFLNKAIEEANSRENDFKQELAAKFDFNSFEGFHGKFSPSFVDMLKKRPEVSEVEQDQYYEISATQNPTGSWGIARIDNRQNAKDSVYTYPDHAGEGVTAYIIDTGIRTTHNDFGGRARYGWGATQSDVHGHGSHVAGSVGGTNYGVAKKVSLVGVQVCNAQGRCPTSDIVGGVEYSAKNCPTKGKCVANMSLGGPKSSAIDNAVKSAVGTGLVIVAAAGNDGREVSCSNSPANVPELLTVGNSDRNDRKSSTSTYGACVDLFAPGSAITSAWKDSDSQTRSISGTSMASPHVAGAVALLLSENTGMTPAQAHKAIVDNATNNVIANPGRNTVNKLLYVGDADNTDPGNPGPTTSTSTGNPDCSTEWWCSIIGNCC